MALQSALPSVGLSRPPCLCLVAPSTTQDAGLRHARKTLLSPDSGSSAANRESNWIEFLLPVTERAQLFRHCKSAVLPLLRLTAGRARDMVAISRSLGGASRKPAAESVSAFGRRGRMGRGDGAVTGMGWRSRSPRPKDTDGYYPRSVVRVCPRSAV